jgi:hypothetical protein
VENEIQAYIRANRAAYTREAITARLQEAGHGEADIEAAWAAIEAEEAAAAPPPAGRSWGLAVGIAFAYVGVSILIFIVWLVLVFALASASSSEFGSVMLFLLPALYLAALVFGVRQGLTRPRATAAATGHLIGAAVMALPFIISGICAASLARLA